MKKFLCIALVLSNYIFAMDESSRITKKILLIAPGSMYGVAFARIIEAIEEETQKPASQIFDVIAGGSTGGIIALGLAHGIAAKDLKANYYTLGSHVFNDDNKHNPEKAGKCFDEVMRTVFGAKLISEALIPVLVEVFDESAAQEFDEKFLGDSRIGEIERFELGRKRLQFLKIVQLSSVLATNDKGGWDCATWAAARANGTLPIFNPACIEFSNGQRRENLIDTKQMPTAGAIVLAEKLYPNCLLELYVVGDLNSNLALILDFAREMMKDNDCASLEPSAIELIDTLERVHAIFPLCIHLQNGEYDADPQTLNQHVIAAEEFIENNIFFSDLIKKLKNL